MCNASLTVAFCLAHHVAYFFSSTSRHAIKTREYSCGVLAISASTLKPTDSANLPTNCRSCMLAKPDRLRLSYSKLTSSLMYGMLTCCSIGTVYLQFVYHSFLRRRNKLHVVLRMTVRTIDCDWLVDNCRSLKPL